MRVCLCVFWCFYLFIVLLFRLLLRRFAVTSDPTHTHTHICNRQIYMWLCVCVCLFIWPYVWAIVCLLLFSLILFWFRFACLCMQARSIDGGAMWGLPVREFSARPSVSVRVPACVRVLVPKWSQTSRRVEQCCQRSFIAAYKKVALFTAPPPANFLSPIANSRYRSFSEKFRLPWKSLCLHLFSPKSLRVS